MEGYEGKGIDLQKRKIWAKFPQKVQDRLLLQVLDPVKATFELTHPTWLIGNHCDELTPWIPFVASKSNDLVRFDEKKKTHPSVCPFFFAYAWCICAGYLLYLVVSLISTARCTKELIQTKAVTQLI